MGCAVRRCASSRACAGDTLPQTQTPQHVQAAASARCTRRVIKGCKCFALRRGEWLSSKLLLTVKTLVPVLQRLQKRCQ